MKKVKNLLLYLIALTLICMLFIFIIISINSKNNNQTKNESMDTTISSEYLNSKNEEVDKLDPRLILVNKSNPLSPDYIPETATTIDRKLINTMAKESFESMVNAAKQNNIYLYIVSTYRSVSYQQQIFQQAVDANIRNGFSEEDAVIETSTSIAFPGTSEHNTGLAIDIVSNDWYTYNDNLYEHFDQTKEYKWLNENAYKFGFIERYPKNKTDITNIIYEPWHYRYVGVEHATIIKNNNLCLEEYLQK